MSVAGPPVAGLSEAGSLSAAGVLSAAAGLTNDAQASDAQLAALLSEIENLSDEEAARLLAEDDRRR
jgi:hypothetical protein